MRPQTFQSLAWLAITTLITSVSAQDYNFVGALQIVNGVPNGAGTWQGSSGSGTNAVQAQCPADHPVSCTNLNQPNYCCPSNNVCSYANGVVACCPQGQTCTGYAQPSQWQPPPATTYYQPPTPTTVYAGAAGGYIAPAAKPTTVYNNPPQFCRTIYAHGPGLPTTQPGDCGTILIVEGGSGRVGIDWRTIMIATGMPMLGAMVLAWRR
ncbi:unnamed protein product [Zymoseptoria tritici ST99CH_1E4]|uniref:Uncharacterized protein n=1 Tax=Zymoseptoria tritici ST99CH_1E4 TaxID=1276532 RepID=A0A2H1GZ80_ZYMTR|nr:unnamed protein product [Zymoseptoria tritici ST99CH_1E4]